MDNCVSDQQTRGNGELNDEHLHELLLTSGRLPNGDGDQATKPDAAADQQNDGREQRDRSGTKGLTGPEVGANDGHDGPLQVAEVAASQVAAEQDGTADRKNKPRVT